eukprot:1088842-Prorocentrum_minimum.AAC.2
MRTPGISVGLFRGAGLLAGGVALAGADEDSGQAAGRLFAVRHGDNRTARAGGVGGGARRQGTGRQGGNGRRKHPQGAPSVPPLCNACCPMPAWSASGKRGPRSHCEELD